MGQLTIEGERNMSKCKEAKKLLPAAVAWSLLLSTTSLFFVFTARWFSEHYTIWVPVGEAFIALIVIANFTLATFMDPGIIPKASRGEDDNDDLRAPLYKTVEVQGTTVRMKWCVTCQFYRPPRCSHCSVCNNCIETFDHHCPWVNNCIGRRNYRFFFMFLLSLSFHMVAIFSLCLVHILHEMERNMSALPVIISISIMVVICILFIPIFGLTCFHIILVSRGRTTNEQVTGKYRGGFNPFSRGCCFNCWFTLCGPQYPGLVKAKKIASKNNTAAVIYHPSKPGGGSGSASGNQVKVYVDNGKYSKSGNLPSLHSPRNYRQMMPASNRDMSDQEFGGLQASQSLDCEPTPPMQRHDGSKNNFFLPTSSHQDDNSSLSHLRHVSRGQYHGSPHPNRQRKSGDIVRSRSQTPDSLSSPSDQVIGQMDMQSPTLQQKIRAIGGIPTPFTVSASPLTRRSNPPTPTSNHGIRPDFMGFSQPSMIRQQPYYEHYGGPISNNGEQRRFLSESELLYERERDYHSGLGGGGLLRDASGQIRELASSPQRGNMYNWKEFSPTTANVPMSNNFSHVNPTSSSSFYHPTSNPTSPIQQNILNNSANSNNRGGMCYHQTSLGYNTPPAYIGNKPQQSSIPQQQLSPIMKKKMYSSLSTGSNSSGIGTSGNSGTDVRPSPISRPNISRPMSFVKALEMTDSIEMNNRSANNMNSPAGTPKVQPQMSLSDRASVYDINYEISV